MKFFDKRWKKVLSGILSGIALLAVLAAGAGFLYYQSLHYANVGDWGIFKAEDGPYCYSVYEYDNGVIISMAMPEIDRSSPFSFYTSKAPIYLRTIP